MEHPVRTRSDESADAAIARLVDEHGPGLYGLAARFCGSRDQAEDLVQEVFLQAYKGWSGFRGESSERTWLYRIAVRACQRMHRKKAGEPERIGSLDSLLPFEAPCIAVVTSEQDDVLQEQIRAEARERMEAAITGLPDEFRIPLILKEIAGFSMRDVAEVLGIEEATAKSRVHRARLKLRAAVDGAIPRTEHEVPPPAYPEQTCLDLLHAKQAALDRGVPFRDDVICERCRSVFDSLDLASDLCRELSESSVPASLRARIAGRVG